MRLLFLPEKYRNVFVISEAGDIVLIGIGDERVLVLPGCEEYIFMLNSW